MVRSRQIRASAPAEMAVRSGGIAEGDFNNDGLLDIAATTTTNSGLHNQVVAVLLGNGDGSFQAEKDFGSMFLGPQYVTASRL